MEPAGTQLEKFYNEYIDKVKKKAEVAIRDARKKTYRQYFEALDKKIHIIFEEAIDRFYADYTPQGKNPYERTRSLYSLLQTEIIDDGIDLAFTAEFIPENMSSYRSGYVGNESNNYENTLYDNVFRHGWHGGAGRISPEKEKKWGKHPSQTGRPYWRTPSPYYSRWLRKANADGTYGAKVANTPPLDYIKAELEKFQSGEAQVLFDTLLRNNLSNIKIELY